MAAHRFHQREDLTSTFNRFTHNHRSKKLGKCRPGSLGPLIAVERTLPGGAFSPAFRAVFIDHTHEHNAPFSGAAKTSFEEVD